MPITPIYGLPYPSLSDPPNGAAQIQALAEAVETQVQRLDGTPASVTASDAGAVNTTSATYTNLAGDPGVVFFAPASGRVVVHWGSAFDNTAADTFGLMSFGIRAGGTIGSGASIVAASDNDSIGTLGTSDIAIGRSALVTGLVSGTQYNAQALYKRFAGGGTSFFARRTIAVVPAP